MEKAESSYYKDYKELKNYRNGKKFYEGKDAKKVKIAKYVLTCLGLSSYAIPCSYGIMSIIKSVPFTYVNLVAYPIFIGSAIMIDHIIRHLCFEEYESKMNYKCFRNSYPNIEMNISNDQLNSFLEYASDKKIEEQNENTDDLFNDFKYMSNDAKIAFLKEQKEYWENVSLKEKYERKSKTKVLKK